MGTVYLAQQESPRRVVALKVMKKGIASRSALRRFEFESQILARLRHPNIAQVYEAGTHDDGSGGVPYFAMEYIPNAKPITEYVKQKKLSTKQRLALFAKVCDAIHHGHQKGIIHRDLKPGNILVDSGGEPKIIDFGVARATDSDMAITTLQTDIGQLIGTLQYMSPEQCDADPHDLDTRSDVYALGVVLYELLTERLPYDLTHIALHEAARIIKEEPPTKLSTISRALRGDVETIALKAMEKDRERRYRSAEALSDDVRHYLKSEPIQARPPSLSYQFSRFARRNRAVVSGIGVAFAALLVGLAGTTYGLVEANTQRELASQRATEADAARIDADTARAEATERADELELVSTFQSEQLGDIDPDGMGFSMRSGLRDKLASLADRRGLDEAETAALLEEYETLVSGADFTGLALDTLEEHIFAPALDAIESQFKEQPLIKAKLLQTMADTMRVAGLLEQATAPQSSALETRRRVLGDEHPSTLTSINNMGLLLKRQGKYDEAETYYREALDGRRRILGDEHPSTMTSINNMGGLLESQGKYDEAEPYYREALAGRRRVLGDENSRTLSTIYNLGVLLKSQGKLAEAELYFREELAGCRRVHGDEHPGTLASIINMEGLLNAQKRYAESEPMLRKSMETVGIVLGDDHWRMAEARSLLGESLAGQKRFDEAEPLLLEGYTGLEASLSDDQRAEKLSPAIERLVSLYNAWHSAEPDAGHDAKATEWRARLPQPDDGKETASPKTEGASD